MRTWFAVLALATAIAASCNDPDVLTSCNQGPEVCDGIDNDCDGQVDDGLTRTCTTACEIGKETCNAGVWAGCTARQPRAEDCDGYDDDCDGTVDNGVPIDGWCYPPGDLEQTLPPAMCRPGVRVCISGRYACVGAIMPTTERCGDHLDNDCDRLIDEDPDNKVKLDVVAIVDISGSNSSRLPQIKTLLLSAAQRLPPSVNFWLLEIPAAAPRGYRMNPACHPTSPAQPCPRATWAEAVPEIRDSVHVFEPSYDAIVNVVTSTTMIAWTGAERILIVFADEFGQSYVNRTEADVAGAVTTSSISIYVWSDQPETYDEFATTFQETPNLDETLIMTILTPQCM